MVKKNDLRPISLEGLNNLQLDNDDNLYWKDKPVKTVSKFRFSWWQGFLATAAAFGTLLSGIIALLEFLAQQ